MPTNPEQLKPEVFLQKNRERTTRTSEDLESIKGEPHDILAQTKDDIISEEDRVLKSIEQGIKAASVSVGLSAQEAQSIFISGGFADQIKSIKEKIVALGQSTKNVLESILIHRTEKPDDDTLEKKISGLSQEVKAFAAFQQKRNLIKDATKENMWAKSIVAKKETFEQGLRAVDPAQAGEVLRMINYLLSKLCYRPGELTEFAANFTVEHIQHIEKIGRAHV